MIRPTVSITIKKPISTCHQGKTSSGSPTMIVKKNSLPTQNMTLSEALIFG